MHAIREMKAGWDADVADLKDAIEGVERHYRRAKQVAEAMAERDPAMRLY